MQSAGRCMRKLLMAPFVLICLPALAATPELNGNTHIDDPSAHIFRDPLGGMVINRTVTVLGNDFYQYFSTAWRELDANHLYTVSVYERPTARFGSEIWIQFRQTRVFHIFLAPARQAARPIGERAAEIVYKNIMQSELQRALFQSEDLAKEEL